MQWLQLDGEKKVDKNTGFLETPGVEDGVNLDTRDSGISPGICGIAVEINYPVLLDGTNTI